jgi:dienelactone hydrolase
MKKLPFLLLWTVLASVLPTANHAATFEEVFFDVPAELITEAIPTPTAQLQAVPGYPDDAQRLTLIGRLYLPDAMAHGTGPYPAVVIMHGSGGVWSNDLIANGLSNQFEEWGELLSDLGYLALFPDSYNPRGIPGNFASRRPHHDPNIDDHLCSPNYERPKDVVAALTYLVTRQDFDGSNVALMGFSHGAQTALNAMLDPSVDLGNYTVSYVDEGGTIQKAVPSPVRIPQQLPLPKVCAFFYGGGSHYGYHGTASSVTAGRYMFHRYTKVLMFHGTEDSLLGVDNPQAGPTFTGNFYPIKQALSSSAQAADIGVPDPLQHHFLMNGVEHSFDGVDDAAPEDWNTMNESADQKAKRLCRAEVLKWFTAHLKTPAPLTISEGPSAAELTLSSGTHTHLRHQWQFTTDFSMWSNLGDEFDGTGMDASSNLMKNEADHRFYRLSSQPIPPPLDAPENDGFFFDYADFGL